MRKCKSNVKSKDKGFAPKSQAKPLSPIDSWAQRLPPGTYRDTNESNIKFEENKSKIIFENKSRKNCIKIDVDGGVIPSSEEIVRCDKLLVEKNSVSFYFVELKGVDIPHALAQLYSSLSISILNPTLPNPLKKISIVVGRKDRPSSAPFFQNWVKKFRKLESDLLIMDTPATYQL